MGWEHSFSNRYIYSQFSLIWIGHLKLKDLHQEWNVPLPVMYEHRHLLQWSKECKFNSLHVFFSSLLYEACPPGTYGRDCSKLCNCSESCDCHPQTGQCTAAVTIQNATKHCKFVSFEVYISLRDQLFLYLVLLLGYLHHSYLCAGLQCKFESWTEHSTEFSNSDVMPNSKEQELMDEYRFGSIRWYNILYVVLY